MNAAMKPKKVLIVGESKLCNAFNRSEILVTERLENLSNLGFRPNFKKYDAVLVGYDENDLHSIQAARKLFKFFKKFPLFFVEIESQKKSKLFKYESNHGFKKLEGQLSILEILSESLAAPYKDNFA